MFTVAGMAGDAEQARELLKTTPADLLFLHGNVALATTKVRLSGQLGGKFYDDLKMRQADVWQWKDGAWKCVLTQESVVKE
jgi:ketosteroid isomerase-like protein